MASFQAKIGWKSSRKGAKKNYRSVSFLPDASQKIKKKIKGKKFKKLKKCHYGFISSQSKLEKSEQGRK